MVVDNQVVALFLRGRFRDSRFFPDVRHEQALDQVRIVLVPKDCG